MTNDNIPESDLNEWSREYWRKKVERQAEQITKLINAKKQLRGELRELRKENKRQADRLHDVNYNAIELEKELKAERKKVERLQEFYDAFYMLENAKADWAGEKEYNEAINRFRKAGNAMAGRDIYKVLENPND